MNTPVNPALFSPVIVPHYGYILSVQKNKPETTVDVLESFQTAFDVQFWISFIIIFSLFIFIFQHLNRMMKKSSSNLLFLLWQMICIILGHHNFISPNKGIRIYMTIFIIFIFIVTIVCKNLFATTLVVTPPPDVIDSFEQLAMRKSVIPIFQKLDTYWNQFSNAKSGPYKEIWSRCKEVGQEKCFTDLYNSATFFYLLKTIGDGTSASITPFYAMKVLLRLFKGFHSSKEFHIAKEQMLSSSYSYIYSKNITKRMRSELDSKYDF